MKTFAQIKTNEQRKPVQPRTPPDRSAQRPHGVGAEEIEAGLPAAPPSLAGHDFARMAVHAEPRAAVQRTPPAVFRGDNGTGDATAAMAAAIRRQDEPGSAAPPAPAPAAPAVPAQGRDAQPVDAPAGEPKLYGLLTRSITGPLTYALWAFGSEQVPGVGIYSPMMNATGTVIADTSVPLAEYELGFVQALIVSRMTATYVASDGRPVQYLHIGVSQQPIRDSGTGSKPWMKKQDVKPLDAPEGYIVNTEDRPRNMAPWQSQDGGGRLSSAEGTDYFCTWLAARHKPSARMHYLSWGTWTVDWGSTFDAAKQTGRSTGDGGKEVQSGSKQGPFTPQEGDPVANESITLKWSATP